MADKLIEELLEFHYSTIDTVIIESYIASPARIDCRVYPVSSRTGVELSVSNLPTLELAAYMSNRSRDEGDVYRILFASTMAFMIYRRGPRQPNLTDLGDDCEMSYMTDMGAYCSMSLDKIPNARYSKDNYSMYAVTDGGNYMYAFEHYWTLFQKYFKYMPKYSDGWALYDVELDREFDCTTNYGPGYKRVETTKDVVLDRAAKQPTYRVAS
ncbi:uncharacterized protein LOC142559620 [Dermacentor variabilis]|uniref:uncharacterized protein LOC142559620 n=1 Tax=Dermacentor variabilis TaxID=34621 RepID=UPI003F5BC4B7